MWLVFELLLLLAVSISTCLSSPSSRWNYVAHEERRHVNGWRRHSRLHPDHVLPIRIAMKQSNLHRLEEHLMAVSDPESESYGKHWSHKKIAETFAPSESTTKAVLEWLVAAGVEKEGVKRTQSMGWLEFNATVLEAENLLRTEYWGWKHEETGQGHVGCEGYWLPEHIRSHVDFITPTVHFDTKVTPIEDRPQIVKRKGAGVHWKPSHHMPPKIGRPKMIHVSGNVEDCADDITPDCLRALYGIPTLNPKTKLNPKNSFAVVQYTPQSYISSDLDNFFTHYSPNQVQKRPKLLSIDGGNVYDTTPDLSYNLESNLDLQYAMTLVNPLNVSLYQIGDLIETDYTSFNNFLDALDATYCSPEDYMDNSTMPTIDAIYPDPLPGGFKGPRNCGGYSAAKVISTSYSYNEYDLTPAYEQRQCNEYAKLGLAGTTFLYCSGDYGVAGSQGRCIDPTTNTLSSSPGGSFAPSFPSTCPYILSVGATAMSINSTVHSPEVACEVQIQSGGGFSNVFPMPKYQSKAVNSWFKHHPVGKDIAGRFNNNSMRGFPDVSANGARYNIAVQGSYDIQVFGTSASTPTFASVLTLINEKRMNAGKGSVGFINPALYANPGLLNDIVSGNNPGCGTMGFSAAPGWDPVTGLGTPSYPRMLQYFMNH